MRRFDIRRQGLTLTDVLVVMLLATMSSGLLAAQIFAESAEKSRQNTCRNNLRKLSMALLNFSNLASDEALPGYINALERDDGFAYHDPRTGHAEPVSWVVMILPQLDQGELYKEWRGGAAPGDGTKIGAPPVARTHKYLDFLVCPSDPPINRESASLRYAVNAGIPDFPSEGGLPKPPVRRACLCKACGGTTVADSDVKHALPRDMQGNGMFFDRFTSSPHFDPGSRPKPVLMTFASIADPKDSTILLTENVDTQGYAPSPSPFDPNSLVGKEMYATAEINLGAIWAPDSKIEAGKPPTAIPPKESYKINVDGGLGSGLEYEYARPSSKHVDGINLVFAGMNVHYMSNKLSYFVYIKLMTSNDAQIKTLDAEGKWTLANPVLRFHQLSNADLNP
jgi:hypothetical protein